MNTTKKVILLLLALSLFACRVKRCASIEDNDKDHKLKYDRKGHVRK